MNGTDGQDETSVYVITVYLVAAWLENLLLEQFVICSNPPYVQYF